MFILYAVILAFAVYIVKFRADFDGKALGAATGMLLVVILAAALFAWLLS